MKKSVRYKGTEVVYSQVGVGRGVLLLHGFLEERGMWNGIVQQLASDFLVLTIDLLGHGETGCIGYVHSMEEQANAVLAVMKDSGLEKAAVIGHSMGGYVALSLLDLAPEMVAGLTLFHSTALPDSEEKKKDRERIIGLVQRNQDVYVKAAIPSLYAPRHVETYRRQIEHTIAEAQKFPKQGIIANIRGMMERKDQTQLLRNAPVIKLVIHGTEDPVISNESIEAQVNGTDIRFEKLENIGHMGHVEAAKECEQLILDFCVECNG